MDGLIISVQIAKDFGPEWVSLWIEIVHLKEGCACAITFCKYLCISLALILDSRYHRQFFCPNIYYTLTCCLKGSLFFFCNLFLLHPAFFSSCEVRSYFKLIPCRWTPYGNTKCIICKQQVHQDGKYCHTCAYSKGDISCLGVLHLLLYCIMKVHNSTADVFCICRSLCDVWQASSWYQVL